MFEGGGWVSWGASWGYLGTSPGVGGGRGGRGGSLAQRDLSGNCKYVTRKPISDIPTPKRFDEIMERSSKNAISVAMFLKIMGRSRGGEMGAQGGGVGKLIMYVCTYM